MNLQVWATILISACLFCLSCGGEDESDQPETAGLAESCGEDVTCEEGLVCSEDGICVSDNQGDKDIQEMEPEVEEVVDEGVKFRLPLKDAEGEYSQEFVFGVDHDPAVYDGIGEGICSNYQDEHFPHCYDEHKGSDYILHGGFDKMDEQVAWVYAAADGVVTRVVDGNYDRCHVEVDGLGGGIDCDGHEMKANSVTIEHEGGIVTLYYHLMKNSIVVEENQTVSCGDPLGMVGSSGISSAPHLHFQVEDSDGNVIDPYAGSLSQEHSYWVEQEGNNGLPAERCQGK